MQLLIKKTYTKPAIVELSCIDTQNMKNTPSPKEGFTPGGVPNTMAGGTTS